MLSRDGNRLAYLSTSPAVWDVETGSLVTELRAYAESQTSVAASLDGRMIASSGHAHTALWNLESGAVDHLLPSGGPVIFTGRNASVVTDSHEWPLDNLSEPLDVQASGPYGRINHFNALSATPGSSFYAGSSVNEGAFLVFNGLWVGKSFRPPEGPVVNVALSPDGHTMLAAGQSTLYVWDADSKGLRRSWNAGGRPDSLYVAWSPDGKLVASAGINTDGSGGRLELFDPATGTLIRTLAAGTISDLGNYSCVAFSPDSLLLVAGSPDGAARWDVSTGKLRALLLGHDGEITGCQFLEGFGDYKVLTSSTDGTTRLWSLEGKELGELIALTNGDWIFVTSDNRFDTNNLDGTRGVFWRVSDDPMHPLPLEIFMRQYFTPGLLTRVLKGEKLPPIRSIADITNRLQPDVKVARVSPSSCEPGRMDVTIYAASHLDAGKKQASGLEDLRLFRDGQLVGSGFVYVARPGSSKLLRITGGYIPGKLKSGEYTFHDVLLKHGTTRVMFSAYAFNAELIKSATATLEYQPKMAIPKAAEKPRAFLLQIGVNRYAARGCDLSYSVNDAEKMSAELSERLAAQGYDVQPVKLESVMGGSTLAAGKQAIRDHLAAIAAQATPDDVFFMSFSGHGYSAEDGEFYVLPSDIQGSCRDVNEALLKSAVSADELADWLRPIDAGQMTLILDACFSAESVQSGDFKPGPLGSKGLGQLAYDKRMRILAASQSDEVAHEYDSLHQGLLTYVLTHDGLDEGKADWRPKDGKITVGEWLAYAANAVPKFVPPNQSNASGSKAAGNRFGNSSTNGTIQIPALFDFSKADALQLEQTAASRQNVRY